ncbi:PfkB family carbohydrate kinase [Cellulomonas sp. HZM]|uniref:PfkB family carbohydrate kinase n=1 Tax=Cellulomonas sp. HZM TaxID=1454010 RepID=UPI00049351BC|nr:PfkB family carbohydrate kinase [Cellulomonas sp. HZM]
MRVVACGLATLDVVQVVDALPAPDQKVVARDLAVAFGGPAANAAATAVALGVPATLVTALGRSPLGDLVRAALEERGVHVVDLLGGRAGAPAVSTVLVTAGTGERAVVSTNATGTADVHDVARLLPAVLDDAGAVLVDGHHLAAGVRVARAARAGVPVLLDGGSWKPGLEELLAHVDLALLSADFAAPGTAQVLPDLPGPAWVARSQGAGAVLVRGEADVVPPLVPADEVVDTLGAGDVLHGAMAAGLARGLTPRTALEAAVDVASLSVRGRGALGWTAAIR